MKKSPQIAALPLSYESLNLKDEEGSIIGKLEKFNSEYLRTAENTGNAIVTAVNNTYGKGINPEAIQELIISLNDAKKLIGLYVENNSGDGSWNGSVIKNIDNALKNIYFQD